MLLNLKIYCIMFVYHLIIEYFRNYKSYSETLTYFTIPLWLRRMHSFFLLLIHIPISLAAISSTLTYESTHVSAKRALSSE